MAATELETKYATFPELGRRCTEAWHRFHYAPGGSAEEAKWHHRAVALAKELNNRWAQFKQSQVPT